MRYFYSYVLKTFKGPRACKLMMFYTVGEISKNSDESTT